MKRIAAITFGCKINQYETACIVDDFLQNDYQLVDFSDQAEIYLINSCTVTNRTDYKSRSALRKALKRKAENSKTLVVITGCYAQRNYAEIAALGPVDLIVDNNKKEQIYSLLQALAEHKLQKNLHFEDILDQKTFSELSTTNLNERSRAFIKVQDGCDFYCTYCAIPFARGHSRSRDKEQVLQQIKLLVKNGYREFVLAGINLGLYGREKNDNYFLVDLLAEIEALEGVQLIRLSSLEPQLFTSEILEFFRSSKKLAPHFHIPLQAGNDETLAQMKRHYSLAEFNQTIEKILQIFPEAALGLDLIVGFPGETDELFDQTFSYLQQLDFTYLHLFSYSKRPGTVAAKMPQQIPGDIIKARVNKLKKLSTEKTAAYRERLLEKPLILRGIVEHSAEKGVASGLSDHYLRFYLAEEIPEQTFVKMQISGKYRDGIKASLI
ncbi:MAG: tRNA (N(6)-L-threonylcarbamoyladenosine(37)-C(2))-methylthiotransferase MtaB [Candidatus Cloacimonadales bacterium]